MTKKKDPSITSREALVLAWKSRADYKGYDKSAGSMFNSWRSIVYNKKGRLAGYPENWTMYSEFEKEIGDGWSRGMVLCRINTKQPYSKENCFWAIKGAENIGQLAKLEYNGVTKTIFEWSGHYSLNYNGVRQRYFKGKSYTPEQILFGKRTPLKKTAVDFRELISKQLIRDKISKMLSSYRNKDKKKGLTTDVDFEYLLECMKSNCVYCGADKNIGLDRIDNSIGHTIENTVPCCVRCNTTRNNNFSYDEMLLIGKIISLIDKNRKNEDNKQK